MINNNRFSSKQAYVRYYQRFKQLSQSPQARISGLVSLTIFTVAFFGLFAILPTLQTIAALNRQIDDAQLVNTKLQQKIVALNRVEQDYLRLTPNLNLVDKVLPETAEFERLAWQINWLINNLGLTISGGNFGEFFLKKGPVNTQLTGLPIEVSVTGSYAQIKAFISQVVNLDRLIAVDEVTITNKKTSLTASGLTANIKLTAYYLPQTP